MATAIPFGPDRHAAFLAELVARGLDKRVHIMETRAATREELQSFHTPQYLDLVAERSRTGDGYLDGGDTPAWRGVYEAAADVVGATLLAAEQIMAGARGARSFPSPACITRRAVARRASAFSTTAAWPWKCCAGIMA